MGHGNYSHAAHAALVADRASKPAGEVFNQRGCHGLMDPRGLKVRESRDSADHPQSLGIVFALDVTGSMGDIPRLLATRELPSFMKLLGACRIPDPQIMFMAIGDATSDNAPLQVGQFESTAELMDQWLTWSYLEAGGGGTGSESYELAFYVLAQHTDLDCWAKRKKRGYLFMTGDELPYPAVSRHQVEALIGEKLDEDIPIQEVIAAAAESYHLFFLIPDLQRRKHCEARWRELLGDHVICMESHEDTCAVAAAIVALTEKALPDTDAVATALKAEGMSSSRIGAVVRALRPYAAHAGSGGTASAIGGTSRAPAAPGWWRRLFG
ncbi:VWA domain-containing protein [Ideonella sp. BN130291]|uniref:VWA domain-containing protein n=1 Tax=Ideonella sp. BN130291 TaxID=3112940 RepID=UPI002E2597E9|nr:VWA domain-containing protein [Ideonella sp. BN130291]